AGRRVNSGNGESAVSRDGVGTNTSRFACARGGGQLAAKTGEKKTGATRIAVAANIGPIGLGIVRVPIVRVSPRSQVASMQRQIRPPRKFRITADRQAGQAAYCAMPPPNDQFSFATSTRLITTSCGRTYNCVFMSSTMRL